MSRVIIIAEAGVNHNGDLELAKQLIDAAAEGGADYVKFQTFKASELVTSSASKAAYQKANTVEDESQLAMIRKLELNEADHFVLRDHCNQRRIKFLSTAFDLKSIQFLEKFGLDYVKIPSGEITNLPYLQMVAGLNRPVLLSTGMATLDEVSDALHVLENGGTPKNKITVLQCTTEYPAPLNEVNLLAMKAMGEKFEVAYGFSDHTEGIAVAVAAVALGARVIEKHFTLDRNLPGPDHKASLEPGELKTMVQSIRAVEIALGDGIKRPMPSEIPNKAVARKSLHTSAAFNAGHVLRLQDLVCKRPGDGISPMKLNDIIGKTITKPVPADYKISMEDLR